MKNLLIVIASCLIILACGSNSSSDITGWDYHQLNGTPSKATTETFRCSKKNGEWEKGKEMIGANKTEVKFDKKGNIEFERNHDKEIMLFETSYFYKEGTVSRSVVFDGLSNKKIFEYIYEASPNFGLISSQAHDLPKKQAHEKATFEWDGKRLKKKGVEDILRQEYFVFSYEYDDNGNMTKESKGRLNSQGISRNYLILEMDKNKNWTKRVAVNNSNPDRGLMEIRTITY